MPNFIKNLGWLGLSEMLVRVSRLATVIILARFLTPSDYGVAALAMACYELIKTLSLNGIGTRILSADTGNLGEVCRSVSLTNWMINVSSCVILLFLAKPLSGMFDETDLVFMLFVLATTFLIYPLSFQNVYLIQRNNKMKVFALIQGATLSMDNIFSMLLAMNGFGAWSIVVTKPITACVWVLSFRYFQKADKTQCAINWSDVKATVKFGSVVFPTELLRMLRLQGDVYIVGKVLGMEVLGIYSFAKNAGIGISMSLINSFQSALLPTLCQVQDDSYQLNKSYLMAIKSIGIILLFVIFQSLLAPIYVPLLFGEKWVSAIPVLQVLCFTSIAFAFLGANSQLLRACNKPSVDLIYSFMLTLIIIFVVFSFSFQGIMELSVALVVTYILCTPIIFMKGYQSVFRKDTVINEKELKNDFS